MGQATLPRVAAVAFGAVGDLAERGCVMFAGPQDPDDGVM